MSQKYSFKSLQIVEKSQSEGKKSEELDTLTIFETGETKTVDFILNDGTRQNFAYSHYLTAWIGKENSERVIKIFFATHLVTIRGFCLDEIYNQLIQLKLKSVKANDERYLKSGDSEQPFIKSILITWKKEEEHKQEN